MSCKHKWSKSGVNSKTTSEVCTLCKEGRDRPATKEEAKEAKKKFKELMVEAKALHRVWHDFCKRFIPDQKWKYIGYDLMVKVNRWARKYPQDVKITRCDDNVHAGSDIVYINHRVDNKKWFGTTVVVIPQCTGEEPMRFFLYPQHHKEMVKALSVIGQTAGKCKKGWSTDY